MLSLKEGPNFKLTFNYTEPWYIEKEFDGEYARNWMSEKWHLSFVASIIYIIFIFGMQRFMLNRPKMDLRKPLALWSASLAIFSLLAWLRTMPEAIHTLSNHGWQHTFCSNTCYYGHTAVWAFLIPLSKVYELGDTVFIVLRKQPLIFLHWYHHVTVMIFSCYTYANFYATGRWFATINCFVHALMYTYYTLRAMHIIVPRWVNMTITIIQSSQMLFGIFVNVSAYWVLSHGGQCHVTYDNINYSLIMYASYFVLFAHYFYYAYISPPRKSTFSQQESKGFKQE